MSKLEIRGGRKTAAHLKTSSVVSEPQEETPETAPEPEPEEEAPPPPADPPTPQEIHAAWEKWESYVPKTEQALGEVLEAFLVERRQQP